MVKTLNDFNFKGKKVLVRADLDVPVDDKGNIQDDLRLRKAVPTIKALLEKQAKQIIIMGHMDRPKGKIVEKLKTDKVAARLSELIGEKIIKLDDCIVDPIPKNKLILLENLRFHKEEKENDEDFAKKLSKYADIYVNNAFATCHREQASMHAITRFIPGCIGKLVEEEIKTITSALEKPEKPFVAVLGGAKLKTKIPVIENLLDKVDRILLGGAMIFTFYKAKGLEIGKSLVDEENIDKAKEIMEKAGEKLDLPVDVVVADKGEETAEANMVDVDSIPSDKIGLDIGHRTIEDFNETLSAAKTIVWNGPLGMFEIDKFAKGTNEIAKTIAATDAISIIGGGDSAAAIEKLGIQDKITHISTGGGASLKLFSGKKLVAIEALEENEKKFK